MVHHHHNFHRNPRKLLSLSFHLLESNLLQKLEIDFEHVEQLMLATALDRAPGDNADGESRIRAALANAGRYFDALDVHQSGNDRRSLAILLKAAFTDLDDELVAKICGGLTAA